MSTIPSAIPDSARRQGLSALAPSAIGVVCGDIGTSPLYTGKDVFAPHAGLPLMRRI